MVGGWLTNWDIHPDGESFVVVRGINDGGAAGGGLGALQLVVNWLHELIARTDG